MPNYDIIIVGSGIVGATAALLLAKNTSLQVAVIDVQPIASDWQKQKNDHRVSAISLASKQIFKSLNVWEKISAKRTSHFSEMFVWDAQSDGKVHFDCASVGELALGYIIEDQVMRASLYETTKEYTNLHLISPVKLASLEKHADFIKLITDDGNVFIARLVIAADGANSWVREQIQTPLKTWDYEHTAIVATVKTENSHQTTAWQRFLPTGPLAFLPLQDVYTSSIVWSASPGYASELLSLDDDAFKKTLSEAFEYKLGHVVDVEKRYHFPLRMRHVKNYVQARIALIGDAAHTIHPLAGQGVNLGLLDAACLADVIVTAVKKNRDYSSLPTLRRYERSRKGDNLVMLAMVEALKHLFASDKKAVIMLRNAGLNFTNQLAVIKNFFTKYNSRTSSS